MNPIVQEDKTGCGIASAAVLAGVEYARAKDQAKRLGISVDDEKLWSETEHVRALLRSFGIPVAAEQRVFLSWDDLPACALLAVKWHQKRGKPFWHWVVFVREGKSACVFDSKKGLKTNRRTDFGRIKPQWYLEVKLRS